MTLAYQVEIPLSGSPASAQDDGRDRRIHHRRDAVRVWAHVDGGWYRVHDLSLGGLALDRPVDSPGIGGRIEGEIHSRAGNRHRTSSFSATVVRLNERNSRMGVAFSPMEAEQIDGLLAILSAVDREYVAAREAEARRESFRRALRRIALGLIFAAAAMTIGFAALLMR